ncbi:MAG: cytosine deaminase [Hoeflea sp.]|uniref:cytosine deaminase n=1 Tax=Hoeflea sp. TaxID=1940281 RepID=UPI001DD43B80|nr:cytosine deaminase [Hoeflea sp.]MBU4529445.1 cytosine deaminase [Alphaproteobacteria bacterium]MBU4546564.1 cytosine deaminase [Alphaproteobacteria bacterium]MBU4550832.1 cytosine deaminase [Alphaproteobacteria bacterium]MBV1723774.1 cytosine deaminase [Hoeflea sp.]MBV1763051.1 cytosine deaminase [Hoeflea sp.]
MTTSITLPASGAYTLANLRLHRAHVVGAEGLSFDTEGFALAQIEITDGKITAIRPAGDASPAGTAIDCRGGIAFPAFVDCHTHIDKGHIWPRAPNPNGSFPGALDTVGADRRANWSEDDVARRMEFSLASAYAHGTKALRTHLDSVAPQEDISWPVFSEIRERWKGRVELQAACLFGIDEARDEAWFDRLAAIVADHRGVLGAVTYMVPDLDQLLDRMFAKATALGLDLDFHADETDDVNAVSLDRIAEAALRHGFEGRILVGHCCSLARQPDDAVKATLDKVARAGLSVVSLPMCNMYLQDRRTDNTTPRWRGVTLLHEMAARGINVAVASDNTRDPFYAYGDLDVLEVYREATRILHFDHPVGFWPAAVTANPARAMGLSDAGTLMPGAGADLVLFRGRSLTELLSRPESRRTLIREGKLIDATVPDYQDLDDLMEL